MPWKETCVMDERMRLVVLVKDGTSIAEASRQFGVSRVTAHEWLKLYELEGMEALRNRSSAPHFHPHALSEEVSERIAALRCERPTWRPLKLVHWLWREPLIGMVDKSGHQPRQTPAKHPPGTATAKQPKGT